jgi:hypothetical protein
MAFCFPSIIDGCLTLMVVEHLKVFIHYVHHNSQAQAIAQKNKNHCTESK